jgi:hypothetical protein
MKDIDVYPALGLQHAARNLKVRSASSSFSAVISFSQEVKPTSATLDIIPIMQKYFNLCALALLASSVQVNAQCESNLYDKQTCQECTDYINSDSGISYGCSWCPAGLDYGYGAHGHCQDPRVATCSGSGFINSLSSCASLIKGSGEYSCEAHTTMIGMADVLLSTGDMHGTGYSQAQCEAECTSKPACASFVFAAQVMLQDHWGSTMVQDYCELWSKTTGAEHDQGFSFCVKLGANGGTYGMVDSGFDSNSCRYANDGGTSTSVHMTVQDEHTLCKNI